MPKDDLLDLSVSQLPARDQSREVGFGMDRAVLGGDNLLVLGSKGSDEGRSDDPFRGLRRYR